MHESISLASEIYIKIPTVLEALAEIAAEREEGTVLVPATAISIRSLVVLTIWRERKRLFDLSLVLVFLFLFT